MLYSAVQSSVYMYVIVCYVSLICLLCDFYLSDIGMFSVCHLSVIYSSTVFFKRFSMMCLLKGCGVEGVLSLVSGEVLVQCMAGALYVKFSQLFVKCCQVLSTVCQVLSSAYPKLSRALRCTAGQAVFV